jgi:fructose transport system permease protein
MTSTDEASGRRDTADFENALPGADATVAVFEEERPGVLRRVQHLLHAYPTAVPFIVLLLGILFFSFAAGSKFFAPFNLSLILQQVTIIAMLGMAQTLVILTAGIDLSVGAIMVLSSVVMGRTAVVYGVPVEIAFPLGLLAGFACGFLNGAIVTVLRLPPFIVTLGTWSIFGALNIFYSRSETIRQQDMEATAPFLQWLGTRIDLAQGLAPFFRTIGIEIAENTRAPLTYGSILLIVVAVVIWYVLNRTAFGRHVYATGDDPDAARLAGINTNRTLLAVYALAGLICAIAAWTLIGRIGGVSPQTGLTANLDSITAVVIGGTSLFGGRGSIVGTLIGALIVGVFRNGLSLAGLDSLWQEFTVGVLIIVAVTLDQWIRRVSN